MAASQRALAPRAAFLTVARTAPFFRIPLDAKFKEKIELLAERIDMRRPG
jgi:hypothetical protein